MPHIRPISDLRNTNEISELCHTSMEPIFITKNGYGDLVVMSIAHYEELRTLHKEQLALLELYGKLNEAEASLARGEGSPAEEVFGKLREKYVK